MSTSNLGYLYRIQDFRNVVDLFETRELHFSNPSAWEDPYEQFLRHRKSDRFFAQCWCKLAQSDAMWRIYSNNRKSLRIRTSRHALSAALKAASSSLEIGYLIEDVAYRRSAAVDRGITEISENLKTEFKARRAADALLLKRDAFEHEAEVRVILNLQAPKLVKTPAFVRVPIDPHKLIQSVFFDPRVDHTFMEVVSYYFKKLKYKGPVRKSTLYNSKDPLVVD